jgi:hypothetical protein
MEETAEIKGKIEYQFLIYKWSGSGVIISFQIINKTVGIRSSSVNDEIVGLDYIDHSIRRDGNENFIIWYEERKKNTV